ncbi:hypothetical protein [Actinoplanes sp. URMC 104]|uniref:hypothetical protein n=1 Tax=Actinoplanes sp. URMC 104 TaxID=3423409 RepID=UPI003F1DE9E5
MSDVVVEVSFTSLPDDDEFVLDQLTDELGEDLRTLGAVRRVEAGRPDADSKGVGEVALAAVAVIAGTDPGYAQALVDLIVGFLGRHRGRTARLQVGDVELTIDQPTKAQASELIDLARSAIERSR